MGTLMRKIRTIGIVSETALEDEWQRRATAAAIEAARGVVQMDGPIPPGTPIGRLSDTELGLGPRRDAVRLDRQACRAGGL